MAFGSNMTFGGPGALSAEQPTAVHTAQQEQQSKPSPGKQPHHHAHTPPHQQPAEFRFRSQGFGQQDAAHSSRAGGAAGSDTGHLGSSAFAELDANPLQRGRAEAAAAPAATGKRDASSMGDQSKQQQGPAPAAAGAAAAPDPAAAGAPSGWASFLSGFQQQGTYASPGARAAGRRTGQRKGATPKASRMQQRSSAAAAGGFGSPAAPAFAFGSPMMATGGPAQPGAGAGTGAGGTPAPSTTLQPGTAMSTDTSLPATFTSAFSAMSVDETPSVATSSSAGGSQPFRGPRAAAVTGKRLFDTPSSAGGAGSSAGTPSPFGSFGRAAAGEGGGSAQQGRAAAEPVPFPGFGGAAGGAGSPGFSFNPGKPSPTPGRSKARQHRSSPAGKPPPAPSFGGFGSPAFGKPSGSTPSVSFAAGGSQASSGGSGTPGLGSAGSFRGFGGVAAPGCAASTPGFSPMMWSPVDGQAAAGASPPAPFATSAASPGFTFGAVDGRQQSTAAAQQQANAALEQAQQLLSQQQTSAEAAAELAAAAAVDLPSEDSTESIAELLSDLSASGSRPAAQAAAETAAMANLRQAVEQLSTAEQQQHQQQQPQPAVPPQQQQGQAQAASAGQQAVQQPAVPAFVFGSPDHLAADAAGARGGSEWLSSPGAPGVVPTTLFDMSPLKSSLDAAARVTAPGAAPSAAFQPAAAPAAATATAPEAGISFTPGKAAGGGKGAAARAKKHTPAKQPRAAAAAAAEPQAAPFSWGAPPAAAPQAGIFEAAQQQQQQQEAEQQPRQQPPVFGSGAGGDGGMQQQQPQFAAGTATATPGRRKLHASQRRAQQAGVQPGRQQQQQQQTGGAPAWPPSSSQQPGAAAAATPAAAGPGISFTVGSSNSRGAGTGTPVRSPRKGRAAPQQPFQQQQQQQQGPAAQQQQQQPDMQLLEALRQADVWTQRAQASFGNRNWAQADAEFKQGLDVLAGFRDTDKGSERLSNLHVYRAAVRIGGDNPQGALTDSLEAIRVRRKNIEAYLRTATCLCKLGCLTAADRVLDKVLDMISANHKEWPKLNSKRQQVHQLAHQQQRVVAAALGCDAAAASATLAALSAGQPVQHLLEGFVSVAVRQGTPAAAVAGLAEAGTGALADAAAAEAVLKDARALVTELTFWEDGAAMLAWLLLRSGQLDAAASIAEAAPNGFFAQQLQHSNRQWGWCWWVLAQVRWQQGDLAATKALLQQGQQHLKQRAQQGSGGGALWQLLVPSAAELSELLVQTQQLLALKEAGNAAIQAKQYDKAAEEYGKALALQPSCGFAAVIHSNRAAALQQQQRLVEALADCSRAVALDPKYARAYLRMAQVLESLHRADRAVVVLQDALKGPANAVDPATTRGHELTHGANVLQLSTADRRKFEDMLATAQVAARRFKTAHHYKALGLTMSASEADIRKAYRALALKHHPDKALQHCRWSAKLGRCGAAAAHVTAASGGVEASLKAAANEVFGFLSAAHEELTNVTSRSKLDRDLRTEEQLYSNNSSSSYSRPASYTYSYGGRRADADYGFDDFFRRTAAAHSSRQYQQPRQQAAGAGSGSSRPSGGGSGGGSSSRWYESNYWADDDEDPESDEDDYGYGGSGYHYRSKY